MNGRKNRLATACTATLRTTATYIAPACAILVCIGVACIYGCTNPINPAGSIDELPAPPATNVPSGAMMAQANIWIDDSSDVSLSYTPPSRERTFITLAPYKWHAIYVYPGESTLMFTRKQNPKTTTSRTINPAKGGAVSIRVRY